MNNNQIHETDATETVSDIKLTTEQIKDLSEWVITQTFGLQSAGLDDDRQKQAFLVMLSAMCYAKDMTERENMLIDAQRAVFYYSAACDYAKEDFITNGFQDFAKGKWNVREENPTKEGTPSDLPNTPKVSENKTAEAATAQKTVSENQDSTPTKLAGYTLEILADKITHVLESDKAPKEIKYSIQDIFYELSSEASVFLFHPGLIKAALPIIAEESDAGYFKGSLRSLQNILVNVSPELQNELAQYEKRFESEPTVDASGDLAQLADQISAIMHNPLLPDKLYTILADKLGDLGDKIDVFTPDNVLHNLEILSDAQKHGLK